MYKGDEVITRQGHTLFPLSSENNKSERKMIGSAAVLIAILAVVSCESAEVTITGRNLGDVAERGET